MPSTPALAAALLAALLLVAATAAAAARAYRTPGERGLWLGVALATALSVLGAGADAGLAAGGAPGTVRGAVAVAVWSPVFAVLYRGLIRWNRYPTALADPHDALNGAGGALAALALIELALPLVRPSALTSPWWADLSLTAPAAALLVVLGTAASLPALAGLARDPRLWLVIGGSAAALVAVALRAVVGSGPVFGLGPPAGPVAAATAVAAACALAAACLPATASVPRAAEPTASTQGAFGVLVAATALLVAAWWLSSDPVAVVAAAGAVCGAALRLRKNTLDLAQLSSTRQLALTDELTGLANRRALLLDLDGRDAQRAPLLLAVLDLDRFKEVNDGLGHSAGDELIGAVGRRLRDHLPAGALVARLGGDEFALVCEVAVGCAPAESAEVLGGRLVEALRAPFALTAMVVHVGASAGLLPWSGPMPEGGASELLRRADAAMYEAKRGQYGVAVYDEHVHARAAGRLALVEELRTALLEGQLVLHHQPQLDALTGRVEGVESLVRWQHPTRGLLPPGDFLPAAEEHGLMGELSSAVLALAADQLAAWRAQGVQLRASVNLSASDLLDLALPQRVAGLLLARGLPASCLVLEVTESVLISDPDRSLAVLAQLADLGVALSIDDYGTGYSSLASLRTLPVHELKLDRSFTEDLLTSPRARAVVASTVELAHTLSLRVVAEGVEDEAVRAQLAALGCDLTQGYLHSPPLPADDVLTWQRTREGDVSRA